MVRGKAAMESAEKPEDYKLAATEFSKALEYDAKCADVYYHLALCYEQMGKLDPGNYKAAISYLNTYLSFRPDAPDKQEIQEKIYKIEFLVEKAGGMSLGNLVGKWKFYWGEGREDDFFDIKIYENKGDLYAEYSDNKWVSIFIMTNGNKNETVPVDKYASSKIQYKDGIISFEANPQYQYTENYAEESLKRFDGGTSKYREIEYRLRIENGILKGEQILKRYKKKSYSKSNGWNIDYECSGDCDGQYTVYFIKQW